MSLFTSWAGDPIGFDDILRIEDTPDILAPHCPRTGMLIWPNVRLAFFRTILGDLLYSSTASMEFSISRDPRQASAGLARAIVHNGRMALGRSMRADILLNTEAVGDEWTGTEWYNRYVDPFADAAGGQATVLLDMFEWDWHEPRHSRSYYHAPVQALSSFYARRPDAAAQSQATAMVALLERRALDILGWELGAARRDALVATFAAKIATLPFRYHAYRKLLKRVRPKLLLGSSGCYGIHAPLLLAARHLGIVTAEYQHGAISEGHDAYNYAPTIAASEDYRQSLPQYLLSYGDWWNEHINVPVEKISIGYPARMDKLARMPVRSNGAQKDILLLSDGIEFELYMQLAQTIAVAVADSGLRVVIRPHPIERSAVLAKWGKAVANVSIDVTPDIYVAFLQAHTVISEVSTGMFEAVGLAERVIILGSNKARICYPDQPFAMANSAQDIVDIVQGAKPGRPTVSEERFWAPDWCQNYRKFLREKVAINAE